MDATQASLRSSSERLHVATLDSGGEEMMLVEDEIFIWRKLMLWGVHVLISVHVSMRVTNLVRVDDS